MKWLNSNRMRLELMGFVAALVLGGRRVKADVIWTQKADMPTTRYGLSTSVVGGKIYAIGGWNPQWGALTRVDEYDPTTDTWTRKADMPTARGFTSTSVVNEKIYVIGGDAGLDPVDLCIPTIEVYDPVTDTWTRKADMPTRRFWFSNSVVDGIIYVIGGKPGYGDGSPHLSTVEAYDPATDTWTRKADMPTRRSFSSTCVVDGKIYVIGGAMGAKAAAEAYDPATDTWMRKEPMPTARYLLGTSVVDGNIYAIGGWRHSANGPLYSTVEVYDPLTDTWTKKGDIPVPTAGLSTSVVDGKIYAIGGALTTHNGIFVHTSAVYAYDIIVDFNGDRIVDAADMCIMIDHWGEDYSLCDIGPTPFGDGIVDVQDLIVLAEHLFEEPNGPTLIAHWALDEAEGIIAYDSAGTNDAFVIGGPAWQPTGGQVDGALQLDGVDDCVITGSISNPTEGPFSVFAWVKGGAPGQAILSQMGGASWLCTDPSEGNLMTELKGTGLDATELLSQTIITDGNWHRIALVWDGSYRTLYVDDVAVAEDAQTNLFGSENGLYIGAGTAMEPGSYWSGLIDDVRIYNRALKP